MKLSNQYSVNIITDEHQLAEALSLRYHTYKKTFPDAVQGFPNQFESDSFDTRSIHIGLYFENENEKKLVGYCRMIIPPAFDSRFEHLFIREHQHYFFKEKSDEKFMAIDVMLDNKIKSTIDSYCINLERENIMYAEIGRLMIEDCHRSLSLVSSFVSSFYAISQVFNIRQHFFICSPSHYSFYMRFGLGLFNNLKEFYGKYFGTKSLLAGSAFTPAESYKSQIENLKRQFEIESNVCFSSNIHLVA